MPGCEENWEIAQFGTECGRTRGGVDHQKECHRVGGRNLSFAPPTSPCSRPFTPLLAACAPFLHSVLLDGGD